MCVVKGIKRNGDSFDVVTLKETVGMEIEREREKNVGLNIPLKTECQETNIIEEVSKGHQ